MIGSKQYYDYENLYVYEQDSSLTPNVHEGAYTHMLNRSISSGDEVLKSLPYSVANVQILLDFEDLEYEIQQAISTWAV